MWPKRVRKPLNLRGSDTNPYGFFYLPLPNSWQDIGIVRHNRVNDIFSRVIYSPDINKIIYGGVMNELMATFANYIKLRWNGQGSLGSQRVVDFWLKFSNSSLKI